MARPSDGSDSKSLLVIGTNGQVGRELAAAGSDAFELVGLARAQADIAEPDPIARVLDNIGPAVVINCAAYTAVDRAESEAEAAFRANATGPAVLAEACRVRGLPLIHLSTDYVFDGSKAEPYREGDPIAPLGVYGASKAAGEEAIRDRLPQHLIVRTAWVYGAHGQNFLKTMLRLAGQKDGWSVVADQQGNPTATPDLAAAILAAAEQAAAGTARWGTYHFAGQGEATWFDFASAIVEEGARHSGRHPLLTPIPTSGYPTPARRPANSRLDSGLFAEHFGVRAKPWRERTREIVESLMTQERSVPSREEQPS